MLDVHALMESSDLIQTTVGEDDSLRKRLSLYQVFLRLYEQNPSLLDEILNLEHSSSSVLMRTALTPYVQGLILGGQVGMVTNLLQGNSQLLIQSQQIWTIGRDRRKSVIAIADNRLSRCHAAIAYNLQEQAFYLIDFESTNGSFVNGEEVRRSCRLSDGDRIRLASMSFTFFVCDMTHAGKTLPLDIVQRVHETFGRLQGAPCSLTDEEHWCCDESVDESVESRQQSESPKAEMPPDDTLTFLRQH